MNHNVEYKNFSPPAHLRKLMEDLIARLEERGRDLRAEFLRLVVEENATRALYRVSLTCEVPGRTLAAHEESHDAEATIRAVFAEIERQLEKHKEMRRQSYRYKRPARREALRREKTEGGTAVHPGRNSSG